ncbi:MAG: flavodoxin family protein [Solirubrobacterales bacterium]
MTKRHESDDILITAINGSPNKKGNTVYLLEEALKVCAELGAKTKLIHCAEALKGQKTPFCTACQTPCAGKCGIDTPLAKAWDTVSVSDGIIMGSPVYFGTVSGQMKAFWDKSRYVRSKKLLLNVPGGTVTVGASQYGGQETTARAMMDMMLVQGMIVIGDGYVDDDCGHLGAMGNKPSLEDVNALKRTRILARRIFEVAKATKSIRVGKP